MFPLGIKAMTKIGPAKSSAPLSAIDIARRAARSGHADAGVPSGFAEQGGDAVNALGAANVVVPVTGVKIGAHFPEVTLPHRLETYPAPQSTEVKSVLAVGSPADIGRLVRKARDERGLSQQEFADLAGVGRRFLSELENGKPTLELGKVLKVSAAAGLSLFARER
jgi:y4mF family transcriptional regulator